MAPHGIPWFRRLYCDMEMALIYITANGSLTDDSQITDSKKEGVSAIVTAVVKFLNLEETKLKQEGAFEIANALKINSSNNKCGSIHYCRSFD
jgi:hypothetical protein